MTKAEYMERVRLQREYEIAYEREKQRLTGLGGWLAVFIAFMAVVIALSAAVLLYVKILTPLKIAPYLICILIEVYILFLVFTRKRKAVKSIMAALFYVLVINVLIIVLEIVVNKSTASGSGIETFLLYFAFPCAYPIVWMLYFRRSKRVRLTFIR